MGQGFIYHLHSDLGVCITFSTLSVSTKIALLVSWGVSFHLCFHTLAQLYEDSFNFTHTPHQHSQVSTLPHVYNTCAHALNAHTNLSVMDTHTYKLTTFCVELWITNYACTKNTLRRTSGKRWSAETEVRKRKYGSEMKSRLSVPGSRMCLVGKGRLSLSDVRTKYWYIGLQRALTKSFSMTRCV